MAVVLFLLLCRFFGTVLLSILGMLDHWTFYEVFEIDDSAVVFLYLTLFFVVFFNVVFQF